MSFNAQERLHPGADRWMKMAGAEPSHAWSGRAARWRVFLIVMVAALMPVSRIFYFGSKQANLAASDLIILLGSPWLIRQLLTSRIRLPAIPLCCLSMTTACFSILYNVDNILSFTSSLSVLVELVKVFVLWLYLYLVANIVCSRDDFLCLLRTWAITGAVVAALGTGGSIAYQLTGIQNTFTFFYRAQGTFENANLYATHLCLSFCLTLLYRHLSGRRSAWVLILLVIQLIGIFFSASRGAMLTLFVSLSVLGAIAASFRAKVIGAALAILLVAVVAMFPGNQDLLESNQITARLATATVDMDDPEAAQRKGQWERAMDGFRVSPIFGVGRGSYGAPIKLGDLGVEGESAHNTYLGVLCETGILGLGVLLLSAAVFAFALLRDRSILHNRYRRMATCTLLTGLMVVGLSGITNNLENYRGLWMLLALMEAYKRLWCVRARDENAPALSDSKKQSFSKKQSCLIGALS